MTILPKNSKEWIECQPEKIILHSSSYWVSLLGFEEIKNTDKNNKVTIHIPKENIFNTDQLEILFNKIHKGEQI